MAISKIYVISWQDILGTRSNRAFKHKDVALKFSHEILEQGYSVWLSELEYNDGVDLNVCVDNTRSFDPGPVAAG